MIDLFIEQSSSKFVKSHNELLRETLPYKLDYSWDAINTLDFVLQESLTVKQEREVLAEKILGLSCYLGVTIYNIWKVVCKDTKLSFVYTQQGGSKALLKMEYGLYLGEGSITVDFFDVVVKSMQMPSHAIEYVKGSTVPLGLEQYRFSYIMHGILMGLSPFIKGVWEKASEAELSLYLHEITNFLSLATLTSLKLKYPTKDKIIVEEIFNPHLILPPLGYKDNFLGSRPIANLIRKLKSESLDKTDILELGNILLESPSIAQAAVGFIILGAYNDQEIFTDLLSEFAIHHPVLAGQLKAPYELYCEEMLQEKSWVDLSKENHIADSNKRLLKEISIGVNPLFFIDDFEILHDKAFRTYFECIDTYLIKEAFNIGTTLVTLSDCPHSVKLQHAWLSLECNAPHISNDITNSLKRESLHGHEKLRLTFIEAIIDPQTIEKQFSSLQEVFESKSISQLHKKQLALICAGCVNHSLDKSRLLNLLKSNSSIVSYPLIKICKKHGADIDVPKKIRKAYWSKFNCLR